MKTSISSFEHQSLFIYKKINNSYWNQWRLICIKKGFLKSWQMLVWWGRKLLSTHWGQVTHICVMTLIIIGSDNGLSPGRRQAIIWTHAGILSMWTLGTNFSETFIKIHSFSFKKMHLKMSSAKWQPSCPGLNVLIACSMTTVYCSIWTTQMMQNKCIQCKLGCSTVTQ